MAGRRSPVRRPHFFIRVQTFAAPVVVEEPHPRSRCRTRLARIERNCHSCLPVRTSKPLHVAGRHLLRKGDIVNLRTHHHDIATDDGREETP